MACKVCGKVGCGCGDYFLTLLCQPNVVKAGDGWRLLSYSILSPKRGKIKAGDN